MTEESAVQLGYRRTMGLVRRALVASRRHPTAADTLLAVAFAAAALVSLSTTFELLRQDPQFHTPAKAGIVISLLVVTLPLALRRRYPLAVAAVVVVGFVVGRLLYNPG